MGEVPGPRPPAGCGWYRSTGNGPPHWFVGAEAMCNRSLYRAAPVSRDTEPPDGACTKCAYRMLPGWYKDAPHMKVIHYAVAGVRACGRRRRLSKTCRVTPGVDPRPKCEKCASILAGGIVEGGDM